MKGIQLLLNSAHGQYIPQIFAQDLAQDWQEIDELDLKQLENPEGENYWDAWAVTLDYAIHQDAEGNVWRLYQDGDLFAYCEELMSAQEYEEFFGEPHPDAQEKTDVTFSYDDHGNGRWLVTVHGKKTSQFLTMNRLETAPPTLEEILAVMVFDYDTVKNGGEGMSMTLDEWLPIIRNHDWLEANLTSEEIAALDDVY